MTVGSIQSLIALDLVTSHRTIARANDIHFFAYISTVGMPKVKSLLAYIFSQVCIGVQDAYANLKNTIFMAIFVYFTY